MEKHTFKSWFNVSIWNFLIDISRKMRHPNKFSVAYYHIMLFVSIIMEVLSSKHLCND